MKKALAIILCVALIAAIGVACSKGGTDEEPTTNNQTVTEEPTTDNQQTAVGGWQRAASPEITKDFKKVFDKAVANLDGAQYEPVAYVASQVVAGKNHCVLCTQQVSAPGAETYYALVYIYEDLEGNAEVTDVKTSTVTANYVADLDGGWAASESLKVTEDAKRAMEKASETLAGATHDPIAIIATQVVAGTNYLMLCESTPTVPNAESYYSLVTVYADLDGYASITDTYEF